jgi:uncharacterized membrane protein
MSKKIFFVLFFAFLIRLIAINQSLWLDEAVTANVVKNFGFFQIVGKFSPTDFHPPLYYLLMKLWTNVFGYSEIALRMPSVLFSLMTGYAVYLIAGIWGAAFFLFNPLIVYYSQEARMYMMVTFFLTAGLYYFLESQKLKVKGQNLNSKVKSLIFMNLFFTLAFLSFYGSIFIIVTVILYSLYKKNYKVFILNTLYFILVALLISPLLYQQFLNSKIALANVTNWSLVLGKANIKNLLLIPIKFSIGRISFYPKWLYWGVAGIWTMFVWLLILIQKLKVKGQNLNSKVKSLLFLFIFSLVLAFLVSFFVPMLQYFRFIYLIPIMAIILAFVNSNSMYRYIVIIGFIVFSLIYLLLPQFHREDWKGLVKSLPKDEPVYMIMASSDPVKYYNQNLIVKELRNLSGLSKEIIVIPYTVDIYGYDYKKELNKKGYQLKKEQSFREVTYEQWIKN